MSNDRIGDLKDFTEKIAPKTANPQAPVSRIGEQTDLTERIAPKAKSSQRGYRRPQHSAAKKPQVTEAADAPAAAAAVVVPAPAAAKPAAPKPKRQHSAPKKAQPQPTTMQAAVTIQQPAAKPAEARGKRGKRPATPQKKTPVRIIPLGGLHEIGKNMTVIECENDMFIVDCGLAFPDEEMLGVDLVIPDFSYVEKNKDKLRGIVLTHGHEDHIGGLVYLLKSVNVPVYSARLTLGLVEGKLKEHGLLGRVQLNVVQPGDTIKLGCMAVEFIHVNHSIPDALAVAIHTPAGVIIMTGDFKIDSTPIEGKMIDLARFGELGNQGVLALLMDSTNAVKPGMTMSERKVGESFGSLFQRAQDKRIIIASFASNIHRIQQIVDYAVKYKRKVAVSGRSMINVVAKATELGYLKIPDGILIEIEGINRYRPDQLVIITTGSQGEPMSALTRMAMSDHRKVTVTPNDFIIISASPIPGNEKLVNRVINELLKLGAEVIYEKMYEVHVSGHACQEELKVILGLVRPQFFIPAHGEYLHLKKNADLAVAMGIDRKNTLVTEIGKVIELDGVEMKIVGTVPAGRVMVDGLGVGDVGSIVLRDRKHLSEDGLIIVVTAINGETGEIAAGPDIVSRGFVYVREAEDMMAQTRKIAKKAVETCIENNVREWGNIKNKIKDDVGDYLWQVTKRTPMILPVIQEI
ncbi:RNase J family beta-CASP ribonuclease [Hydrogenoanaerobacterium sp.]|uniref:RNase J family beta-CASP ribonuclease n=1 Tax=Hydrogenoanaerobacterium sp. TaxID=2953763 RepID=UPI0037BE9F9E